MREAVVILTLLGHPGRNSFSSSLRPPPTPSSSTSSCLVPSNTPPAPAQPRSINYSYSLPAASTPELLKTWTPVKPGCPGGTQASCMFKASQVTPVYSQVWEPGPSFVPATTPTPPQTSGCSATPGLSHEARRGKRRCLMCTSQPTLGLQEVRVPLAVTLSYLPHLLCPDLPSSSNPGPCNFCLPLSTSSLRTPLPPVDFLTLISPTLFSTMKEIFPVLPKTNPLPRF